MTASARSSAIGRSWPRPARRSSGLARPRRAIVTTSKIDHLGIAVRDLAAASKRFEQLLGAQPGGEEEVPTEHVKVKFFTVGESRFELLEPTSPASAVAKFLEKRGEGIHHVCLRVADVAAEVSRLRAEG